MKRVMTLLCCGLLLALALVGATVPEARAQAIYKWVDEQGRVHYGDRPPTDAAGATAMTPPAAPAAPAAPQPDPDGATRRERQQRLLDAFAAEREQRRAAIERARAEAEARRLRCQQARRRLALLERSNLLYTLDKEGNRRYLDDAERRRARESIEAQVRADCQGS